MSQLPWSREKNVLAFLLGAGLWSLSLAPFFIFHGSANSSSAFVRSVGGPAIAVGLVFCLVLWFCAALGWRSLGVGGSGGLQLKLIVVVLVAGTLIGMVPVAYWTGACLLRRLDRMRDPFAS